MNLIRESPNLKGREMKKSLIDRIEELERAVKPDYSQYIADMVEMLKPIPDDDDTGIIELCSVSFEEWAARL